MAAYKAVAFLPPKPLPLRTQRVDREMSFSSAEDGAVLTALIHVDFFEELQFH